MMFILFLLAIYLVVSLVIGAVLTTLVWEPHTGLIDMVKLYGCTVVLWPLIVYSLLYQKK